MMMYGGGAPRPLEWYSRHPPQSVRDEGIRLLFYPFGDMRIRRSAVGRIVFETAEARRVMRRRDDNAVREATLATAIVGENCVRNDRSGSIAIGSIDHHFDTIRCQHFQRTRKSWL